MTKALDGKSVTFSRYVSFPPFIRRLPPRLVLAYFALQEEIKQLRQRLSEYEDRDSKGEVTMLRDISKKQAREEIKQLFLTGRTLYYSDIADELKLDLKLVVDICREFQGNKEIGVDKDALART